jgi:hypothetical protein
MVGFSDASSMRDLDVFFALLQSFDQREQRLRSGGQFGVLLSCPQYQRDHGSLFREGGVCGPPHRVRRRPPRVKLSTITFSARRASELATMPVVLTRQVNSATIPKCFFNDVYAEIFRLQIVFSRAT